MDTPLDPVAQLTQELARLPGIGARTAQRLAHFIVQKSPQGEAHGMATHLADALLRVSREVCLCVLCRNLATQEHCSICADAKRNVHQLCIVESVSDLDAIERLGSYSGRFFVLHGALSPLEGRGPERLGVGHLLQRIAQEEVTEVILALNATLEGDTTALYLASTLDSKQVRLTRLASGMPHGGELEYLDRATLGRAFSDRRVFGADV